MTRPASSITGQKPRELIKRRGDVCGVSVRWTKEHHITFRRLGGSKWLREQVEKHMGRV